MEPASSALSLVIWQGWGVLSVMAVLTALLGTILLWLLPFPDSSLSAQLTTYPNRMALKDRLGAAPPFRTYLTTLHRFNEWLSEWFGPAFSGQAFERCLALAFFFPITLFLISLVANGLASRAITWPELFVFLAAFIVIAFIVAVAFRNFLRLSERAWKAFGGDKDLAQTIARVLMGGFAVMVAFTISFSLASAFSGTSSSTGSVLSAMAGGFVLAFAFVLAYALAGAALFSIAIAILGGAALAFASRFAFLLFLFFILLPVVNASVDWLSWGLTRFILRKAERAGPTLTGKAQVAGLVLVTFIWGALMMIALSALLPNMLEGLNYAFTLAKLPPFSWQPLAFRAAKAPWTDGFFVTGMILTAIVPAASQVVVGLTGMLARFTPGVATAAEAISDHPEAPLTASEKRQAIRTLMISRVWYAVATAFVGLAIAAAAVLISVLHAPVAAFLSNVALCATSWSHGQCSWFDA